MTQIKQYKLFNDFLDKLPDNQLQYYWYDLIEPFLIRNKIPVHRGYVWWENNKARRWPETYKI
jgi:hypothetical protein